MLHKPGDRTGAVVLVLYRCPTATLLVQRAGRRSGSRSVKDRTTGIS